MALEEEACWALELELVTKALLEEPPVTLTVLMVFLTITSVS